MGSTLKQSRGFIACYGRRYTAMMEWLDENCGIDGWSMTPTGRREALGEDAVAVYVNTPTCAVAFAARWLVPGDPPGFYDLRQDEPARRVPAPHHHSTPNFQVEYIRACH